MRFAQQRDSASQSAAAPASRPHAIGVVGHRAGFRSRASKLGLKPGEGVRIAA
jgi:hypothetical protein